MLRGLSLAPILEDWGQPRSMVSKALVIGEDTHKASLLIFMLTSFSRSFSACTKQTIRWECESFLLSLSRGQRWMWSNQSANAVKYCCHVYRLRNNSNGRQGFDVKTEDYQILLPLPKNGNKPLADKHVLQKYDGHTCRLPLAVNLGSNTRGSAKLSFDIVAALYSDSPWRTICSVCICRHIGTWGTREEKDKTCFRPMYATLGFQHYVNARSAVQKQGLCCKKTCLLDHTVSSHFRQKLSDKVILKQGPCSDIPFSAVLCQANYPTFAKAVFRCRPPWAYLPLGLWPEEREELLSVLIAFVGLRKEFGCGAGVSSCIAFRSSV